MSRTPVWYSPTISGELRGMDRYGSGAFKAPRKRGSRRYEHRGVDYATRPAERIYAPVGGIVRLGKSYADSPSHDLLAISPKPGIEVVLMYVRPLVFGNGEEVYGGDLIGHATSLQNRYPGITDHVHLEVRIRGSVVADRAADEHVCVDPGLFLAGGVPAGAREDFERAVNEGVVENPAYRVPEDEQRRMRAVFTKLGAALTAALGKGDRT